MAGRVIAILLLFLTACSTGQPEQPAGLGRPVSSMTELVAMVKDRAGACENVVNESQEEFTRFAGAQLAGLYQPFIAEWATCSVSQDFPRVGLILFRQDQFKAFQLSWRDAMADGRVSDGPSFSFGNGFAVTQGFLGVSKIGLYYLRCHYDDPRVHQVPADVEHCVFANPERHHH
jgi:hypothetical protein